MTKATGRPRVGNRKNHDPALRQAAGEMFKACTEAYTQELDTYKAFAAARRSRRKFTQERLGEMYEQTQAYICECADTHTPMTIAGMQLAMGIDRNTWSRAKAEELDYLLEEFVSLHNVTDDDVSVIDGLPWFVRTREDTGEIESRTLLIAYSEFVEKCTMLLQDQLERNCYTNKGNPAGSIFGLKAQFDWREEQAPTTYSQTLVIADAAQAQKAMKMLTNVEK